MGDSLSSFSSCPSSCFLSLSFFAFQTNLFFFLYTEHNPLSSLHYQLMNYSLKFEASMHRKDPAQRKRERMKGFSPGTVEAQYTQTHSHSFSQLCHSQTQSHVETELLYPASGNNTYIIRTAPGSLHVVRVTTMGIRSPILRWILSFLTPTQLQVAITDITSSESQIGANFHILRLHNEVLRLSMFLFFFFLISQMSWKQRFVRHVSSPSFILSLSFPKSVFL